LSQKSKKHLIKDLPLHEIVLYHQEGNKVLGLDLQTTENQEHGVRAQSRWLAKIENPKHKKLSKLQEI